mgnify:CR=1 FL=1
MSDRLNVSVLLAWFAEHQRPLPWRRDYQPYHIWIAEIMGQQTQMERVVNYLRRWLEQFPDMATLAAASEQEVFKAWEGLGYYSRARNLHRAARVVAEEWRGEFPTSVEGLMALPGVGRYTAGKTPIDDQIKAAG